MNTNELLEQIAIAATDESAESAMEQLTEIESELSDYMMDAETRQMLEQVIRSYQILLQNIIEGV